jgi:hypothetical protein
VGFLDDAVRSALATIDEVTLDGGIQVTITHRAFVQQDEFGDAEPYAAPVSRACLLKQIKQAHHSAEGREIQNQSRLFFPRNIPFSTYDEITMPDGSMPPILEIGGLEDRLGGRFYTVVTLGQAARSVRGNL